MVQKETVVNGIKIIRIPTSNWSLLISSINTTLSITDTNNPGTLNGSTSSIFIDNSNTSIEHFPNSDGSMRNNNINEYDIITVTFPDPIVFGEGIITIVINDSGSNRNIALLNTNDYPIDTTKDIYPSVQLNSTTYSSRLVMEIF